MDIPNIAFLIQIFHYDYWLDFENSNKDFSPFSC
jgi:hypothetical protein